MNRFLAAAGFHGTLGVAFGAWSAHGAEAVLNPEAVEWVKTGASYQLWHALALLGVAALLGRHSLDHGPLDYRAVRLVTVSGLAFFLGALLFSGSLYLLALSSSPEGVGQHWLVYLTPLGGSLLILGWVLLLVAGIRKGSA